MAELTVDIVANSRGLNQGVRDAQQKLNQLSSTASRAGQSVNANFTPFIFQAGQALSDFSVAGVLGAANNIEFLTQNFIQLQKQTGGTRAVFKGLLSSLTGPAGILFAVSAASSAFLLFGDDIASVVNKGSQELKRLEEKAREVADSLIKLSDATKVSFEGTFEDLKKQRDDTKAFVDAIEANIKAIRAFSNQGIDITGDEPAIISTLEQQRKIDALLEERSRVLVRQKAIYESINATVEDETARRELIGELEQTNLERKEKDVKKEKEKLTELQKAVKENEEIKRILDEINTGERDKLLTIQLQNQNLKDQFEIAERIRKEQLIRDSINVVGGNVASFSQTDEFAGVGDIEDTISKLTPLTLQATEVSREYLDVVNALGFEFNTLTSEQARLVDLNLQLADVVRNGTTEAFVGLFDAIGSGEDPFAALRQSIGSFAQDLGRTFIGFGIAGESLKVFLKNNPGAAIIAGGGLVALGAALKRSAQSKVDNFTSTGTAGGFSVRPEFLDPRLGRGTGVFQAGQEISAALGREGPAGSQSIPNTITLRARGRDLIAVVDTNQQLTTEVLG